MLLRRYHKKTEEKEIIKLEVVSDQLESELGLDNKTVKELKKIATEAGIEVPDKIKKVDLIQLIREG